MPPSLRDISLLLAALSFPAGCVEHERLGPYEGDAGDDGDDGSIEVAEICSNYADKMVECYADHDEAEVEQYCTEALEENTFGPECAEAHADLLVCVSALSCEALMTTWEVDCADELAVRDAACA